MPNLFREVAENASALSCVVRHFREADVGSLCFGERLIQRQFQSGQARCLRLRGGKICFQQPQLEAKARQFGVKGGFPRDSLTYGTSTFCKFFVQARLLPGRHLAAANCREEVVADLSFAGAEGVEPAFKLRHLTP
ncbi:MAG TPA: hypothetical protein PK080_00735 [Hyphomonadaceae bacterium]|nr:hypothetical protein [Hyphomonadaceae bacterium]